MRRRNQNDNDIREALSALLSDIESMYEGAKSPAERGQPEEFFGPFSVWKLEHAALTPYQHELAESGDQLRKAKSALALTRRQRVLLAKFTRRRRRMIEIDHPAACLRRHVIAMGISNSCFTYSAGPRNKTPDRLP